MGLRKEAKGRECQVRTASGEYGRVFTRDSIESMHMEGVFRTQKILLDEEKIGVTNE